MSINDPYKKIPLTDKILSMSTTDGRTMYSALLAGDISEVDLRKLNDTSLYPDNSYPKDKSDPYNAQDAMANLMLTIGPFLSDKVLHDITHRLTAIEVDDHGQQAFRNSRIAKSFFRYEVDRQLKLTENDPNVMPTVLPNPILHHLNDVIYPARETKININSPSGFETFVKFNLLNFPLVGKQRKIENVASNYGTQVENFDNQSDLNLSEEPPQTLAKRKRAVRSHVEERGMFKQPNLSSRTKAVLALDAIVKCIDDELRKHEKYKNYKAKTGSDEKAKKLQALVEAINNYEDFKKDSSRINTDDAGIISHFDAISKAVKDLGEESSKKHSQVMIKKKMYSDVEVAMGAVQLVIEIKRKQIESLGRATPQTPSQTQPRK